MNMRRPIFILLTASCISLLHAQNDPFAAWSHSAAVQVTAPGLTRVELSREMLDASRTFSTATSFSDLRLINPANAETPFLIEEVSRVSGSSVPADNFKASLQGLTTVLEFAAAGNKV